MQKAVAGALQAVQAVRDTFSSMVADVSISTHDLLAEFNGAPLEKYAERIDFYKQQITTINCHTSTQVRWHSSLPIMLSVVPALPVHVEVVCSAEMC